MNNLCELINPSGYTVRTQLVGLLYRKLLRLNSAGDRTNTPGKVLNVINNDLRRIDDIFAVVALALQFPIFLGIAWSRATWRK